MKRKKMELAMAQFSPLRAPPLARVCLVGEKMKREKIKHGNQCIYWTNITPNTCIGFRVLFFLFSFSLLPNK
jgi:hypothetical protein